MVFVPSDVLRNNKETLNRTLSNGSERWSELMTVQAYILFKVTSGAEREVCKRIADFDEVLLVGTVYGEYDVIAKISVPDMRTLDEFLSVKIRKVPSVLLTSTMIIAREYKGKNQRAMK